MASAQTQMPIDSQADLFGEASAPAYKPKHEHLVVRLIEMLEAMRAASAWPWDPVQRDLKRNHVWPHLLSHLDPAEAADWRARLETEAQRLDTAHRDLLERTGISR